LSVVADKRLPPGSCLCESDFGAVDASLATQLRAMRSAVSRALKQSVNEMQREGALEPSAPGGADSDANEHALGGSGSGIGNDHAMDENASKSEARFAGTVSGYAREAALDEPDQLDEFDRFDDDDGDTVVRR